MQDACQFLCGCNWFGLLELGLVVYLDVFYFLNHESRKGLKYTKKYNSTT
jgi:hypothetical protein